MVREQGVGSLLVCLVCGGSQSSLRKGRLENDDFQTFLLSGGFGEKLAFGAGLGRPWGSENVVGL